MVYNKGYVRGGRGRCRRPDHGRAVIRDMQARAARATLNRELCQAGNRAALSGSQRAPRDFVRACMSGNIAGRIFQGGWPVYQTLYRKWRPRVFEDVAGQPHITATLKHELTAGRVAHAYLFTGSRGTGKTTCAKILAKAVNCLHPRDGDPCNECEICRGIDSGAVLDVTEIDAASNNGVDNIRDLREEVVYSPAAAKYRVYIIDEVHMLSGGAFNALLKTLEEPPAHVIFILATTEVYKIPATILSRCQRFDFRRIPVADIAARLTYVAKQEQISLTPGAAELIGRLADGALRDALSLLERCAGAGGPVDETLVAKAVGLTGREYLFELSDAARRQDYPAALAILDRLYASSLDIERLCGELIGHFRALLLTRTARNAAAILNVPADGQKKLAETAAQFTPEELLRALDTLQATLDGLRRSSSRRVSMEMGLLRLCRPELDVTPSGLLARIAALEQAVKNGVPAASPQAAPAAAVQPTAAQPVRREPETPQPETAAPPAAPAEPEKQEKTPVSHPAASAQAEAEKPPVTPGEKTPKDGPFDAWPEALEILSSLDAPLRGFLNNSSAVIHGDFVLVDCANAMFADLIRQASHQKPLKEAVQKASGRPYKVGILTKNQPQPSWDDDPMNEILRNASAQGLGIQEHKS